VPVSSPKAAPELIALQQLAVSLFGPRLAISIDESSMLAGVSRDTTYSWIRDRRLIATKIGKRTLVLLPSLLQLMAQNVVTGSLQEIAATAHRREQTEKRQGAEAAAVTWTPADIGPATTRSRPAAKRAARGPAERASRRQAQPGDV
jgi:excisionase family DNA binding protein